MVPGETDGPFLLEVSDQPPAGWDDLLTRDPAAEYSHTRHWAASVAAHVPTAKIIWISVRRDNALVAGLNTVSRRSGQTVWGLPLEFRRWDSNFEGTSGGPVIPRDLAAADQDRIFTLLVEKLAGLRRGLLGTCSLVLCPFQEKRFGPLISGMSGWVRQDAPTAAVSLSGGIEDVEINRLVNNKRNERNRGLRRGVEFFATTNADLLEEYYAIYEQAARHWGVPPNPLGLLKALLADPDQGVFFTCVRFESKVIGGHLNLHRGDRVLVWNGVTDPAYARQHFPATICMWADLVEACRRGAKWLDMGGSGGVHSLSGFKKFFGADLQMRGLYFNESSPMALMKKTRTAWRRSASGSEPERWHDKPEGRPTGDRP